MNPATTPKSANELKMERDPAALELELAPVVSSEPNDKEHIDGLAREAHFIRRRAEGASFRTIAGEIGVAASTLVNWSRDYREEILNTRAMHREALQCEALSEPAVRIRRLAKNLAAIEAELDKRNIADLPTSRLFSLADTFRRRILQETGHQLKFVTPNDGRDEDLPDFEWTV